MSDATNEVRLWRARKCDPPSIHDWYTDQLECDDVEYIARPRADDEAREERLKRAERERDEARALLREAREFLDHRAGTFGLPRLTYRIDAALGDAPGPPPDAPPEADRRGEDGEWCERSAE